MVELNTKPWYCQIAALMTESMFTLTTRFGKNGQMLVLYKNLKVWYNFCMEARNGSQKHKKNL
jgi:hypothetical protein